MVTEMDEESYMSHDNDDSSSVVDETLTTTYANPTVRNENVGVDGIDGDEGDERGDLELSAIEGAVLGEYTRLSTNLKTLSDLLSDLSTRPSSEILDALRGLERKSATVFTLLKASVYSLILDQELKGETGQS